MPTDRPKTPNLDKMLAVKDTSEAVGDFVMEHLSQQGIVLARWRWEQLPCSKSWARAADGGLVEISWLSRRDEVEIDPFDCPCPTPVREEGKPPHPGKHARWALVPVNRSIAWINDELARFFGIDPEEMERERSRLLEWARDQNADHR
jgi:hypothetical protein